MSSLLKFNFRSETITRKIYVRDFDNNLVDADQLTVKVYDPSGNLVDTLAESKLATGTYRVTFTIPSNAEFGDWYLESECEVGTYIDIEYHYFIVQAKPYEK